MYWQTPSNTLVMRQGQNKQRSRGRPNNRKSQSGRTFDSNGPDVKIRGTAAHIYEKYQSLARDAQASGDRIIAENYLQHAEHYFRVMLAAGESAAMQNRMNPTQQGRPPMQGGVNGQQPDGDESQVESSAAGAQGGGGPNGQARPVEERSEQSNGQSTQPSVQPAAVAQPNDESHGSAEPAESAGEPQLDLVKTDASASGGEAKANGQPPKRRGRPPRARAEAAPAPAPASEPEAPAETPEPASS